MPPTDQKSANELAVEAGQDAAQDSARVFGQPVFDDQKSDGPRAETRGIYTDPAGARRVIAAGDQIPDGWERVEDGDVSDRAERTETARDDSPSSGRKSRRKPAEDKAQKAGEDK